MKLGVNERLRGKKLYREVWKPVITDEEDYTGLYEISNLGRVRSLDREVWNGNGWYTKKGQILTPCKNKLDYLYVGLSKNGKQKTYRLHRLVAFAFVKGYFEGAHIDHIDTCKTKNIWTNLRWVTPKENSNNEITLKHFSEANKGEKHPMYGKTHTEETKKKMSEAKKGKGCKKVVCVETEQVFDSLTKASEHIGVDKSVISACCRGKTKTCKGYHWKYYEDYLREVDNGVS